MKMKSVLVAAVAAGVLAMNATSVSAAEVGGDVKTNVKTGVVLQSNKGIANKNEVNLGSVTGKSTSVGGDVKATVKTGAIIQSNTGIANKNEVNIGSVTD